VHSRAQQRFMAVALPDAHLRRRLAARARSAQDAPQRGQRVSADAAARLVRLEAASEQQAGTLAVVTKHVDKLGLRVRVATSDLKQPIRQVRPCGGNPSAVPGREQVTLHVCREADAPAAAGWPGNAWNPRLPAACLDQVGAVSSPWGDCRCRPLPRSTQRCLRSCRRGRSC
jgi:hypothetical protein